MALPAGIGTRSESIMTHCKTAASTGTVLEVSKYTDTVIWPYLLGLVQGQKV